MNPALVILILIGAFVLWVLCSQVFIPVGTLIANKLRKMEDIMETEIREEKTKSNEVKIMNEEEKSNE